MTAGLIFLLQESSYMTRLYVMGYPTKVQLIQRKESQQWYINFPAAIAQGMEFAKGEDVQWTIADKGHLILSRNVIPPNPIEIKKLPSSKQSNAWPGNLPTASPLQTPQNAETRSQPFAIAKPHSIQGQCQMHPLRWPGQKCTRSKVHCISRPAILFSRHSTFNSSSECQLRNQLSNRATVQFGRCLNRTGSGKCPTR